MFIWHSLFSIMDGLYLSGDNPVIPVSKDNPPESAS